MDLSDDDDGPPGAPGAINFGGSGGLVLHPMSAGVALVEVDDDHDLLPSASPTSPLSHTDADDDDDGPVGMLSTAFAPLSVASPTSLSAVAFDEPVDPDAPVPLWRARYTPECRIEEVDGGVLSRVNEFDVGPRLGSGSFATVYLVERAVTGSDVPRQFAMKVMSRSKLMRTKDYKTVDGRMKVTTGLDKVMEECKVMRNLYHRNVLLLFEIIDDIEADDIFLILELWDQGISMKWDSGSKSFCHKETNGAVPLEVARKYTADVASGLAYLKKQGIIHRDIKPDNLLVNSEGRCAIVDFGCAKKLKNLKDSTVTDSDGTPAFFAPEVCKAEGPYDAYAVDVWALGVTLYIFLTARLPFFQASAAGLMRAIIEDPLNIPSDLPEEVKDLLSKVLDKDPKSRISVEGVLLHPWVLPAVMEDNIPVAPELHA